MKQKYILLTLISFLLFGCYEDKGKYDYTELNNIEIKNIEYDYYLNEGDSVVISPVFKFSGDSLPDSALEFTWKEDQGEIISHEKELKYIANKTGNFKVYLNVYFKQNRLSYFKETEFRVSSKYKIGWMILSEKDGKSRLCFVQPITQTINEGTEDEEKVTTYKEFVDVYKESNGVELGSKPIMLQEHWLANDNDYDSEIFVLQQGGQGCIELDELYFKKILSTHQEFLGEAYPEDFKPVDALYGVHSSYILNYDGRLFVRKLEDKNNMHSGYFLQIPAYYDKGLSVGDIIPTKVWKTEFFLIYDKLNKRFLGVKDNYNGKVSGEIKNISYTEIPKEFTDLNNIDKDYVCCNYLSPGSGESSFFSVLKEPGEDKYYAQEFTVNYNIQLEGTPKQYEIPNSGINANSKIVPLPNYEYVFITSGVNNDELYLFDRDTKQAPVLIASFGGKSIASIQFNRDKNDRLAIGFESGEFHLYDISNDKLRENKMELLYSAKQNFGKIVDVEEKVYGRWAY